MEGRTTKSVEQICLLNAKKVVGKIRVEGKIQMLFMYYVYINILKPTIWKDELGVTYHTNRYICPKDCKLVCILSVGLIGPCFCRLKIHIYVTYVHK